MVDVLKTLINGLKAYVDGLRAYVDELVKDFVRSNDVYLKTETYSKKQVYSKDETYTKDEVYSKDETYTKDEVYSKDEACAKDEILIGESFLSDEYTWDGDADGLDTFMYNGFSYYKISENVREFSSVLSVECTLSNKRVDTTYWRGTNCYSAGDAIVVTKEGTCKLGVTGETANIRSFTAPSSGIYFLRMNNGIIVNHLIINCQVVYTKLFAFSESGKKFRITVDDTGTLSATEVTS